MLQVIPCPVSPGLAPVLSTSRYWGYTSQWNLLDYPSLVSPVTKVNPAINVSEVDYVAMHETDRYHHALYRPEKFKHAPVGLQFVGRRYEGEKIRVRSYGLVCSTFSSFKMCKLIDPLAPGH